MPRVLRQTRLTLTGRLHCRICLCEPGSGVMIADFAYCWRCATLVNYEPVAGWIDHAWRRLGLLIDLGPAFEAQAMPFARMGGYGLRQRLYVYGVLRIL